MAYLISTSISEFFLHLEFRESYRKTRATGEWRPKGWNTCLDGRTMLFVNLIDFIERCWFIWVPAIIAFCLLLRFLYSSF